ncbi:MAG TPA: hypothetical protein VFF40_01170 [Acidimicrobiia bacterium]|nr:hypothetical protein [Acidimicrobiia bacterium]
MSERALLAAAIVVIAIAIAAVIRRRQPSGPPRDSYPTPRQIRRGDFPRPDAPWLVALFSSETCGSCRGLADQIGRLDSETVATHELTYEGDRALHDRYDISAVPMVVIADAEGIVRGAFVGPTPTSEMRNVLAPRAE